MEEIEAGCEKLNLPFKVSSHVLKKSDLAKFKPQNTSDLSIILHKTEGRLLLTGENGLYDKLIKHELQVKSKLPINPLGGNLLIVLYEENGTETESKIGPDSSFYEHLCKHELIKTVATEGKQPLMQILTKHFKVIMASEDRFPEAQQIHLMNTLHG
jgi:hypothetical protein